MKLSNEELTVIYEALNEYLNICKLTLYKSNAKPDLKEKARRREIAVYLLQDRITAKLLKEIIK